MRSVEVMTFGAGMSSTMGCATAFSNEETHRKNREICIRWLVDMWGLLTTAFTEATTVQPSGF
jgi:hypothetical protein